MQEPPRDDRYCGSIFDPLNWREAPEMTTEHMEQLTDGVPTEDDLRRRAIKRLRAKAGFWTHLVVYLAVNAFLVVIWAFTGSDLFWPVFPIVGWGIGVAANAWDAFGPEPVTAERIQREMEHLRG
jgi:hypothetical protein